MSIKWIAIGILLSFVVQVGLVTLTITSTLHAYVIFPFMPARFRPLQCLV
jgi:hypothetical protein